MFEQLKNKTSMPIPEFCTWFNRCDLLQNKNIITASASLRIDIVVYVFCIMSFTLT